MFMPHRHASARLDRLGLVCTGPAPVSLASFFRWAWFPRTRPSLVFVVVAGGPLRQVATQGPPSRKLAPVCLPVPLRFRRP